MTNNVHLQETMQNYSSPPKICTQKTCLISEARNNMGTCLLAIFHLFALGIPSTSLNDFA